MVPRPELFLLLYPQAHSRHLLQAGQGQAFLSPHTPVTWLHPQKDTSQVLSAGHILMAACTRPATAAVVSREVLADGWGCTCLLWSLGLEKAAFCQSIYTFRLPYLGSSFMPSLPTLGVCRNFGQDSAWASCFSPKRT